jgi:hypothetical protein
MNVEEQKERIEQMKAELAQARKAIREEENKNSFAGIKRRINVAYLNLKKEDMTKQQKTDAFVSAVKEILE